MLPVQEIEIPALLSVQDNYFSVILPVQEIEVPSLSDQDIDVSALYLFRILTSLLSCLLRILSCLLRYLLRKQSAFSSCTVPYRS